MVSYLYDFTIYPIELFVEIVFSIMYKLIGNCGIAIIALSLVIQTAILPLYKRSDSMQEEERKKQQSMAYWVKHIKSAFKGDERFMMLSTYYRQQEYKPWYSIRISFSILLQIPFFVAAYHYLSNLNLLKGQSFLFISDLGKPDKAIAVGNVIINILPILMTIFNLLSGMIYTKKMSYKDRIQVFGLAIIFLVILYNSPAGLVLYWTMNNIYSLLKNLLFTNRNQIKSISEDNNRIALLLKRIINYKDNLFEAKYVLFVLPALFMAGLFGWIIPLSVLNTSPSEFVIGSHGPTDILFNNLCLYLGVFLVWGSIIYFLTPNNKKVVYIFCVLGVSVTSLVEYMFFGTRLGTMSSELVYDNNPIFGKKLILFNVLVMITIFTLICYIALKYSKLFMTVEGALLIGMIILSTVNGRELYEKTKSIEQLQNQNEESDKIFKLSKTGNNIIVIMLDRAISGYIPFIFEEKPELAESFNGFTYYPNTLSFGGYTNLASPALFGGYEYTPQNINQRNTESLSAKHDEALLVMPRIFAEKGYDVVVCDPPYAGSYKWVNDLSIYDEYEKVNAYDLEGKYTDEYFEKYVNSYIEKQEDRFVYYSLLKTMPLLWFRILYSDGEYLSQQQVQISQGFMDSYAVLCELSNLTQIEDDLNNNFICLQNSTTHTVSLLKTPEYIPSDEVAEAGYNIYDVYDADKRQIEGKNLCFDTRFSLAHYHSNMAALIELSKWFSYLKDNDCWDNTRVIIVADHGRQLGNFDYMLYSDSLDIEGYNPLLMEKDFGEKEYKVSNEFMTNADVPTLAFDGVISYPINPFTNKLITNEDKKDGVLITTSENWDTDKFNGYQFDTSDAPWYRIKNGYIFDFSNWEIIDKLE